MLDSVDFISIENAKSIVNRYHYSKVFPRINKFAIGGFKNNELVSIMILSYGTRPLHTIKLLFPSFSVKDYIEVGKLCVSDDCPKNTESYFIAKCIKLIKNNHPQYKVLFSWSDGIIGKPGYVYQSSNFYYGGYIWTEMYIDKEGKRIHPRSLQGISIGDIKEGQKYKSRSFEITTKMGFKKYFGVQFRYVYPLCSKEKWVELIKTSPFEWSIGNYPKDNDCMWKHQVVKGKREYCDKPFVSLTDYIK